MFVACFDDNLGHRPWRRSRVINRDYRLDRDLSEVILLKERDRWFEKRHGQAAGIDIIGRLRGQVTCHGVDEALGLLLHPGAALTHTEELLEVVQQRPVVPGAVPLPVLARVREQHAQSVRLLLKTSDQKTVLTLG